MIRYIFLLFSAAHLNNALRTGTGCGKSYNAPVIHNYRIVNGEQARSGAWPWIVPLYEDGVHKCAASIINDQWLVTAAHCFPNSSDGVVAKNWTLETGDHEIYHKTEVPLSQKYSVEYIIKHENYSAAGPTGGNDIALLKVIGRFEFKNTVQPICLPEAEEVFDELENNCYTAGWGETFGTAKNEFALQQVHQQILDWYTCDWVYEYTLSINNICFGDGRKGTCMGDSGGPLMCKRGQYWALVGVTSWGNSECKHLPGVFTQVSAFTKWIDQKMVEYSIETLNKSVLNAEHSQQNITANIWSFMSDLIGL